MTDDVELLPCRKCGSKNSGRDQFSVSGNRFVWECRDCDYMTETCDTEAEAIAAWNTRATDDVVERVARQFHETYERLAPQFSYETRKASAVPWEQVPENNRKLMIATVGEVLATLSAAPQVGEVTEAMIEWGVAAIRSCRFHGTSDEKMAAEVYRAMRRAALTKESADGE